MQLYRIICKPQSSFSSQLQSDTFFGSFCWSYRYCYGEDKLEKFLKELQDGRQTLVFSNAFPTETLPLPLGIRDSQADFEQIVSKTERKQAYQDHKKVKNAKFVQREWFLKIQKGDCAGFTKGLVGDGIESQSVMHNMVSRQGMMVENIDGSGNLYEEDERFMKEDCKAYDIYVLTSLSKETLEHLVEIMFMLGIGKNKSTGKGAFSLLKVDEEEELLKVEGNAFVALSNFVPAHSDPVNGWYKTLAKYGKLDREYANDEYPFKKPVLFLQAGAVFKDSSVKPMYGRYLQNISVNQNVIVNACTIALPIIVNEF
jgi:CRISPR-associated protein Csm4